jgi:hypothetical protein
VGLVRCHVAQREDPALTLSLLTLILSLMVGKEPKTPLTPRQREAHLPKLRDIEIKADGTVIETGM